MDEEIKIKNPLTVIKLDAEDEEKTITENGVYSPEFGKRFNPLVVSVPIPTVPTDEAHEYTTNGTKQVPDGKRYNPITVNVHPTDVQKTITENGRYEPEGEERFNPVVVNVPVPVDEAHTFTENGTYPTPVGKRYDQITVDVHPKTGEMMRSMLLLWLDGIKNAGEDEEHSYNTETWVDLSGNGHDGEIWAPFWGNDCLYTRSEIDCGSLNPSIFTLEIAIGHRSSSSYGCVCGTQIIGREETQAGYFSVFQNGMDITYSIKSQSISGDISSLDGKEILTFVVDGENIKSYVNGVFESSAAISGTAVGAGTFLIGAIRDSYSGIIYNLGADIYSVRIWSAGFSDEVVAALARETAERFNITIGGNTT